MTDEKYIEQTLKAMIRMISKKKYELDLPKRFKADVFSDLKIKYGKGRHNCSYAGFRTMVIDLNYWQFGNKHYEEYRSFHKDPVIGGVPLVLRKEMIMLILAHELAHYIQFTYKGFMPHYIAKDCSKPHGKGFQKIYRYLRSDYVNPQLVHYNLDEEAA